MLVNCKSLDELENQLLKNGYFILFPWEVTHSKSKNFYPVLFGDKELMPERVKNLKKMSDLNIK